MKIFFTNMGQCIRIMVCMYNYSHGQILEENNKMYNIKRVQYSLREFDIYSFLITDINEMPNSFFFLRNNIETESVVKFFMKNFLSKLHFTSCTPWILFVDYIFIFNFVNNRSKKKNRKTLLMIIIFTQNLIAVKLYIFSYFISSLSFLTPPHGFCLFLRLFSLPLCSSDYGSNWNTISWSIQKVR